MHRRQDKIIELHSWKNGKSVWVRQGSIFCFYRDGDYDKNIQKWNEFTKIVPVGCSTICDDVCICVSETPYQIMELLDG